MNRGNPFAALSGVLFLVLAVALPVHSQTPQTAPKTAPKTTPATGLQRTSNTATLQPNAPITRPGLPPFHGTNAGVVPIDIQAYRPYVSASVNEKQAFVFLWDTGASGISFDYQTGTSLGLRPLSRAIIGGTGGSQYGLVLEGVELNMGGIRATSGVTDAVTAPSDRGKRVAILGVDLYNRYVTELDYRARALRFYDPETFHYKGPGSALTMYMRGPNPIVLAHIKLAGRAPIRGNFLIDSGAEGGIHFSQRFASANQILDAMGPTMDGEVSGFGGRIKAKFGRVPEVRLGSISFTNAPAGLDLQFVEGQRDIAGLIGGELLLRLRVFFDFKHKLVIFEPSGPLYIP